MATTTTPKAVVLAADRLMLTSGPVTLDAARKLVGQEYTMPTLMANETTKYRVESVSQNKETGDVVAWMTSPGRGGRHVRIVSKV